jgi:hypothetical protein
MSIVCAAAENIRRLHYLVTSVTSEQLCAWLSAKIEPSLASEEQGRFQGIASY